MTNSRHAYVQLPVGKNGVSKVKEYSVKGLPLALIEGHGVSQTEGDLVALKDDTGPRPDLLEGDAWDESCLPPHRS